MSRFRRCWLVCRSLYELTRYDAMCAAGGFRGVTDSLNRTAADVPIDDEMVNAVADALVLASCLYWKRVLCLQRSVCLVRLLRAHGIVARLIIGYRPLPFMSHAWVDVAGRVVHDSQAYQHRLQVLFTA